MLQDLASQGLIGFFKIAFLGLELIYFVYAIILVFQVRLMNKSFRTPVGVLFTIFALVHFFIVLGLLILSVAILL